jgi:hypothetical protein
MCNFFCTVLRRSTEPEGQDDQPGLKRTPS